MKSLEWPPIQDHGVLVEREIRRQAASREKRLGGMEGRWPSMTEARTRASQPGEEPAPRHIDLGLPAFKTCNLCRSICSVSCHFVQQHKQTNALTYFQAPHHVHHQPGQTIPSQPPAPTKRCQLHLCTGTVVSVSGWTPTLTT